MKMSKSVLKICFSLIVLFILIGCTTFKRNIEEWPLPSKFETKPVEVIPIRKADIKQNGYYLSKEHASDLVDNIDELKAYIQKLEASIKTMKEYYKTR